MSTPWAPHVDDARDRLEAMNRTVPQPTEQQVAASSAIEQSRAPVNLKYRTVLLITARPSIVQAARVGEPSLTDSTQIIAPALVKASMADVTWALKPDGKPAPALPGTINNLAALTTTANNGTSPSASTGEAAGAPAANTPANALQMRDVSGDNNVNGGVVDSNGANTGNGPGAPENAAQPPAGSVPNGGNPPPPAVPSVPVDANGQPAVWPSATKDNGGLPTVAPKDSTPLPAASRAAEAPAQVNDVPPSAHPENTVGQNAAATGKRKKKNPKPKFTGNEESSSTHKKKKGVHKLNPF